MNSVLDLQTILGLATIVGLVVIGRSILRIFNVGLGLIISIVVVVLILQYGFDLSPRELWYEFSYLPQKLMRLARNIG
ncbi:hypothetical protein [Chamaesiphon minutus]|uniref:Uncharacterized protein n=1 Tax=Chamaesiphon minutus (strain ATCC 27169 / PCC 6605) TaxID=1173020 RepID=K9UBC7_CHAP6|nr:hypothetical protein [Chamaesiphon minutus]AFY92140.1 hypothetical protein Cha6605_0879 [Chamaesiphon minutus PCC 6605]